MVDKATLLEILLGSLIFVARIVFYTVIVVVAVLAVDVVALWLLNLLTDLNTWLSLLFFESIIMMAFGVGVFWLGHFLAAGEHIFTPIGWKRPTIYPASLTPRYPWFWFSVLMAGFVLFILFVLLGYMFYGI